MNRGQQIREERVKKMPRQRNKRLTAACKLLVALHEEGFTNVWMESTQITGDGHYYAKVVIPEYDMDHHRLTKVQVVAEQFGAKVALHEVRMNQQSFSRITLWPFVEGDDE